MDTLYNETNGHLLQLQNQMAHFEHSTYNDQAFQLEANIIKQFDLISGNCEKLQTLVSKEAPLKRRNAAYRVDQLKYDFDHLKAAFDGIRGRRQLRFQTESNRQELFARKNVSVAADATAISIDDSSLLHHTRLSASKNRIDEFLDTGTAMLENLRSQHASLKSVKTRILNVINTLGLSNTVMRLIEKRTSQDKLILFGGMIVTSLLMLTFYMWFKH